MKKGTFVVFEGGEGSGKDTVIATLQQEYAGRDDVVFTREPGGTVIGERIRELLLAKSSGDVTVKTELLLFLAARAQLLEKVIAPALQAGKTVVSNRFGLSTIAYQIYGRERKEFLPFLQRTSEFVVGDWTLDAYVLLDVSPETGLARVANRADENTRFDDEKIAFHERVRGGYLAHVGDVGIPYIIDAELPLIEVQRQVQEIFRQCCS